MAGLDTLPVELVCEIAKRMNDQQSKWRLMVALDRLLPVVHSKRYMIVTEEEMRASPLTRLFVQRHCQSVMGKKPLTVEYDLLDRKVCQICFALTCECFSACGSQGYCYECKGFCLDVESVRNKMFKVAVQKPYIKTWVKYYELLWPSYMKQFQVRILMKMYIESSSEIRRVQLSKNWMQLICNFLYTTADYSDKKVLFKKRLCLYKFN